MTRCLVAPVLTLVLSVTTFWTVPPMLEYKNMIELSAGLLASLASSSRSSRS